MRDIDRDLTGLLKRIGSTLAQARADAAVAEKSSKSLSKALDQVHDSWSGSWAGYHASLYFGEYERPGLGSIFSVEWGGLQGFDPKWKTRSEDEVRAYVESTSGSSIHALEVRRDEIQAAVRPLYTDVEALVVPILELAGDSSSSLLKELGEETWGVSEAAYLKATRPGQMMSRDSEAISQGMKIPPHVAVRAQVVAAYSGISESVTALERARRALQQSRTVMSIPKPVDVIGDSAASLGSQRAQGRWVHWTVVTIIAVETFLLARPHVVSWFDTTFTQEFLTQPTRFGFAWSDVMGNLLAAVVIAPFAWLAKRRWR